MIGIVVLNYNSWESTIECLISIFSNNINYPFHIYLVDNASTIKCPNNLKKICNNNNVTFLVCDKNRGYSAGNNIGIKKAIADGCQYLVIANNDIIFLENSINNLYEYLQSHSCVGIVGPKIYLPDGNIQEINMGIKTGIVEKYKYLLKKTFISVLVKHFIDSYCAIGKDMTQPFEVHSVSGCCFMMKNECFQKLVPFDENTFLYEEELIIGLECEKYGYKTVYCTNSEVIHAHGQSTKKIKAFAYMCFVESELYYCRRYLNAPKYQMIPLYAIRSIRYLIFCIQNDDYRKNFKQYVSCTINMLNKSWK